MSSNNQESQQNQSGRIVREHSSSSLATHVQKDNNYAVKEARVLAWISEKRMNEWGLSRDTLRIIKGIFDSLKKLKRPGKKYISAIFLESQSVKEI